MNWQDNVALMVKHIAAARKEARRNGVVGMSKENLRQLVSTKGLTIPQRPDAFCRLFDDAYAQS